MNRGGFIVNFLGGVLLTIVVADLIYLYARLLEFFFG